jgi:hypothetical protein
VFGQDEDNLFGERRVSAKATVLGDKVIVAETQTDHEGAHYIVGEAHKLTAGGTLFETTWYLEPAPASSPWKLGVEGRSELGASAVLLAWKGCRSAARQ